MPGKGLRPFTYYMACIALMACTSCMTFLPEFQGLESPYRGEHRVAAGVYGATNGPSVAGGALFYSVGISDTWEWSTLGSLGLPSLDYSPSESITYSLFTGPKWTNRNNILASDYPLGFWSWMSSIKGLPTILLVKYIQVYSPHYISGVPKTTQDPVISLSGERFLVLFPL